MRGFKFFGLEIIGFWKRVKITKKLFSNVFPRQLQKKSLILYLEDIWNFFVMEYVMAWFKKISQKNPLPPANTETFFLEQIQFHN